MNSFALPKIKLLRKPWQYQDVYRLGRRISAQNFSLIYVLGAEEESRLGISIHGVKKATRRNRIKRIIRECFRLHSREWLPAVDVVITVRQGFSIDSSSEFCQAANALVKNLFQAAKNNNAPSLVT